MGVFLKVFHFFLGGRYLKGYGIASGMKKKMKTNKVDAETHGVYGSIHAPAAAAAKLSTVSAMVVRENTRTASSLSAYAFCESDDEGDADVGGEKPPSTTRMFLLQLYGVAIVLYVAASNVSLGF